MLTHALSGALNENGTPRVKYTYTADHPGHVEDDGCGVLYTGPVKGTVVLSDGTRYDVGPEAIEFLPGHDGPICHHIELIHQAAGVLGALRDPQGVLDDDGLHHCTEACGAEATT
jgi:hypothetical protein